MNQPGLHVGLLDEEEINHMIDSRQYWIFVGDQRYIDHLEGLCQVPFMTIMGSPPKQFRCLLENQGQGARFFVVNFAKKSELPWSKLRAALLQQGIPGAAAPEDIGEHDVFYCVSKSDWEKKKAMNARATAAYEQARQGVDTPQIEYALRRIMGRERLEGRLDEFTRAWNEAPVVDADENESFYANILVRAHEPKDGVV